MNNDIFNYINKFFNTYLRSEISASDRTITNYHDTFKILFQYIKTECNFKLKDFSLNYFTKDFVLSFLQWLETNRNNSVPTRNTRYETIRSFSNFVLQYEIDNINLIQIINIPRKKEVKKKLLVMTENQIKLLLQQPDNKTKKGRRELAILSLLYDSAVRISELLNLKVEDINLDEIKTIKVWHGKGNKNRIIPISDDVADIIRIYINDYKKTSKDFLFTNSKNTKLCANAIRKIINKYWNEVKNIDENALKHVYPHLFRHSKATHLIDKGVSILEVKEDLGHAVLESTQIYVTTDILKKRDALKTIECKITTESDKNTIHSDEDIFEWLDNFNNNHKV